MEDFLSQDPFAGQAASLLSRRNANGTCEEIGPGSAEWLEAAETCVLARIRQIRVFGGLPKSAGPLDRFERQQRLEFLLHLWADGCLYAVDERLFADILYRHKRN
jgi:hypothetical protein